MVMSACRGYQDPPQAQGGQTQKPKESELEAHLTCLYCPPQAVEAYPCLCCQGSQVCQPNAQAPAKAQVRLLFQLLY